ncbi:hypothetical protein Pfo_031453 [Paulownia fortunei]|nr:hypothetical protein Pfo_031453 [Paulownia fortunei]
MPPHLNEDDVDFLLTHFERPWYQEYREELIARYGYYQHIMTGVHVNYSPADNLIDWFGSQHHIQSYPAAKNRCTRLNHVVALAHPDEPLSSTATQHTRHLLTRLAEIVAVSPADLRDDFNQALDYAKTALDDPKQTIGARLASFIKNDSLTTYAVTRGASHFKSTLSPPTRHLTATLFVGVVNSFEEAYQVQDAVLKQKGEPVAGYKVSLTSPETQAMFDSDSRFIGGQLANKFLPSNTKFHLSDYNEPLVEVEMLFTAKEDLTPDMTPEELLQHTTVAPALELPDARFGNWFPKLDKYLVLSDTAVGAAVVYGTARDGAGLTLKTLADVKAFSPTMVKSRQWSRI